MKNIVLNGQRIEGRLSLEAKIWLGSAVFAGVVLVVFGLAAAASGSNYLDGRESVILGSILAGFGGGVLNYFRR
jgi:hypothetical protein